MAYVSSEMGQFSGYLNKTYGKWEWQRKTNLTTSNEPRRVIKVQDDSGAVGKWVVLNHQLVETCLRF